MEKIGILVVSYGARAAAMIDVFSRTPNYDVKIYVADRQRNPFNLQRSVRHVVIPDLNIQDICRFAEANRDNIDFGIVGPEKPILNGVRDLIEKRTNIPVICPTKKCAIEASKVAQRRLFEDVAPEVNPRFRIFAPKDYRNEEEMKKAVHEWLDELGDRAVVKPDNPAAGKGVGVWGDHFTTRDQLLKHFQSNFQHGSVIIEEKIEGEESSFQALCDGKHLVPLPETRDYKRAFNDDKGPNTGGMGSYKSSCDQLPFMSKVDRAKEMRIISKIFRRFRAAGEALRGIPFYVAFIHTGAGPKILENNSRPGDPEILNILPIFKDDFVDVCFKMLEGNLTHVELEGAATVATYKVPPNYGGYMDVYPNQVNKDEIGTSVSIAEANELVRNHENIRVYPASMELRGNEIYALKSRAICVVGIGEDIESARDISLKGINAVKGGALWYRKDIGSELHIQRSVKHMNALRRHKQ